MINVFRDKRPLSRILLIFIIIFSILGTIVFGYFFLYFCSESVAELFFENQLVFSTTIFHNNSFKITGSVKSATIEEYKEYIIDARNSMDEYCQEWIDLLFPTEIQQENDFFCYTEINGKSEYINRYEQASWCNIDENTYISDGINQYKMRNAINSLAKIRHIF